MIDLRLGDCLEIMRDIPDGSVDAVITDPPYNSGKNYGETTNDSRPYDEYWEWLSTAVKECNRIARLVIVKHSSQKIYDWVKHIDRSRMLVWYKPFSSGFKINGFATHFEPLWVTQGQSAHWSKDVIEYTSGFRPEDSKTNGHPAQMPERFVGQLLTLTTDEGMTILDPFMGSGTTGAACMKLNRNFIGIEINPDYFAIAKRRIEEAQMQGVLL